MQYISFYKNRLPFKPKTNVIIYFDVTGIGMKRYYGVISEYYDRIVEEFRRGVYNKLGKGISFSLAKAEQFFVDEEDEGEDSQS